MPTLIQAVAGNADAWDTSHSINIDVGAAAAGRRIVGFLARFSDATERITSSSQITLGGSSTGVTLKTTSTNPVGQAGTFYARAFDIDVPAGLSGTQALVVTSSDATARRTGFVAACYSDGGAPTFTYGSNAFNNNPTATISSATGEEVGLFIASLTASQTITPGTGSSAITGASGGTGMSFLGLRENGGTSVTIDGTFSGSDEYCCVAWTLPAAGPSATADQEGARFGADDASESAHTWLAAQDSNVTHPLSSNLLLRALVDGTGDLASAAYTLRYQKNGSGGYVAVPVGTTTINAGTYFGGASGGTNPTTSTTITIPASLPTTCVLCLHFTSRDHASGTGQPTVSDNNSGGAWTQRQFTTDRKAQWWWKRYEAGLSSKTITISGAVGSLSARLVVIENAYATGDPFTDFVEETNASGNETHAAITPTHAKSAVVFAVYNYANDNAVTSVTAATTGAPGESTGHLSTGGSDCGTHVAVWNNHPASSSGSITWAQTNGTTYSHAYAVRPAEVANDVYVAPSSNITGGGEATTARLTAPGSKSTSDFVTGRRWDDENGSDSIDITTDDYTEVEWCLQAQSPAVNGDYFDFRVYAGASPLASYSFTPRWTIGTPATPSMMPMQGLLSRLPALRRF